MALTFNRFARFDWAQMGDPLVLILANGVDYPAWTNGLANGRTEATLSTTAPDTSSMTAAEADDGAGQYPDGTYTVYVAYKRDATTTYPEMISGASPVGGASVSISSGPSNIQLSTVPTSGDAQVTDREIYIIGGTMTRPYYVGDVGDNTTTSYKISVAVATLEGNKVMKEVTGDYPQKRTYSEGLPPKFERIEVWQGRIWGSVDNTLYYSEVAPYNEDFPSSNAIEIPRRGSGVGAKITQLRVHKTYLYVFFEDAVYVVSGTNIETFRVDAIMTGVGASGGPHSVLSVGDSIYFLDRLQGPMVWAGTGAQPTPIGVAIEDFWKRLDKMRLRNACAGYSSARHEVVWYVTEGRYDRNNRRLVWDEISQSWMVDHAEGTAAGLIRNEIGEKCILEGNSLGDIFQYDLGNTDGAYTGTRSGTPTTAAGVTLADTAVTFPSAADCEGAPVFLYDSSDFLLQMNRVVERTSATVLRLAIPISGTVATYRIGTIPVIHEGPPLGLDPEGPAIWTRYQIRYKPTTTAATVYVDLRRSDDTDYTNIGSFSTDGDGQAKFAIADANGRPMRGEDIQRRLRCDTQDVDIVIYDEQITAQPTGGL